MGPFNTVQQIKAANKKAGKYFFSPATMSGFNSKLHKGVWGGRFFVVSNQFVDSRGKADPREYRVCKATDAGDVNYVYNEDHSKLFFYRLREAREAAREAAEMEEREAVGN